MTTQLQEGIGRVRRSDGAIAGTCFLVSARHVLSCAHVANAALGRGAEQKEPPSKDDRIAIEFPFFGDRGRLTGRVVEWRPMGEAAGSDIAVLELERDAPARPYRLAGPLDLRDREFRSYGFPVGQVDGIPANGVLDGANARGWLIALGDKRPNYFVEPGFSDAPLLDRNTNDEASYR